MTDYSPAPPSAPPSAPQAPVDSGARIYDRGFRAYDGERTGVIGSLRSLVRHSMRHAMGLGRSFWFKVLPVLIVISAYLPAVAIIGFVALIPSDAPELTQFFTEFLPTYASYYGFVTASIYLFAGLIGPLLLCSDRRNGLLGVYLAAALNRPYYLIGKGIAVVALMLLVTLGPPLLLLLGLTLQGFGPDGFVEWMRTLLQIVISSFVIGMLYTAIALAISATTDRTMIAAASVLAVIPGSSIVSATMVDGVGLSAHLRLFDLLVLPLAFVFRIHDEGGSIWPQAENPTWTVVTAWLVWTFAALAWVWFRYRRLLVRR